MNEFHNFKPVKDGRTCTECKVTVLDTMPERERRVKTFSRCPYDPEAHEEYLKDWPIDKTVPLNFKGWRGMGLPDAKHSVVIHRPKIEGGGRGRMRMGTYVGLPSSVAKGLIERACLYDPAWNSLVTSYDEFVIFESSTCRPDTPNEVAGIDLLDKRAATVMAIANKDSMFWLVSGYAYVL